MQELPALNRLQLFDTYEGAINVLRSLALFKVCLTVFACWLVFVLGRTLRKAYLSPLSDVPGPWVAKFTRVRLMRAMASRSWDKINIRLHRQYGK